MNEPYSVVLQSTLFNHRDVIGRYRHVYILAHLSRWWMRFFFLSLSFTTLCLLVMIAWARAELCHVPLTMAIFARNQSTMTTAMARNKELCLGDTRSVLCYRRDRLNRCPPSNTYYLEWSLVKRTFIQQRPAFGHETRAGPYRNKL